MEEEKTGSDEKENANQPYLIRTETRIWVGDANTTYPASQDIKKNTNTPRNPPRPSQTIIMWASIATAIATIGILIVTGIYSYYARRQWQVMEKTLNATDLQMRVSQRPYVDLGRPGDDIIVTWRTDDTGKKTGIILYFQNTGNTPARRFYINGRFHTHGSSFDPEDFHHLQMKPSIIEQKTPEGTIRGRTYIFGTLIPAHDSIEIIVPNLNERDIEAALTKSPHALTLSGNFEYMNVFNEYCCESFMISWESRQFRNVGPSIRGLVCPIDIPNICKQEDELDVSQEVIDRMRTKAP